MPYLLINDAQESEMLSRIGVAGLQDLLNQIPAELQRTKPLDLPPPLSELELHQHLSSLASQNAGLDRVKCFLGGGVYDHFIPSVVDEITGRGEFYTAYTPYQAEASQGSLQAFFEYQSLMCELTGMPVSNASLYEGGTAVSEAVLMAVRTTNRSGQIVVLGTIHPEKLEILRTILLRLQIAIKVIPPRDGVTPLDTISSQLTEQTAAVVIQQPNAFGCLEDVAEICERARAKGVVSIVSFDPISLGLLPRPGDLGADIAVAEGQGLGIPLQYGGPFLGIFTCREEFVRRVPGRLIGLTTDRQGKPCYVLNLQTREQHIRREKATSNICTNQGLMALRATVYLASLGPQGMREVAELSCRKANWLAEQLKLIPGVSVAFKAPFFCEFVITTPKPADEVVQACMEAGYAVGPTIQRIGFETEDSNLADRGLLIAVTEQRSREELEGLVRRFREIFAG